MSEEDSSVPKDNEDHPDSTAVPDQTSSPPSESSKEVHSKFYESLVQRLTAAPKSEPSSSGVPRLIQCKHCSFTASDSSKLQRHLRFRHFIVVEDSFKFFCPVIGCQFICLESAEISGHIAQRHEKMVKIKTVYHEELTFENSEQDEDFDSGACEEKSTSRKELYYCDIAGCNYSFYSWKNFKVHYGRKHKIKDLDEKTVVDGESTKDRSEVENVSSPNVSQRSHREKKVKRKFMDEEWEVSRPKKPKVTKDEMRANPSAYLKDMRIKINPSLISFDPVQKALIEMSQLHSDLNDEVSKIDGMMEKLISDHCADCGTCKNSPHLSGYSHHSSLSKRRDLDRIKELEREISRIKNENRILSGLKDTQVQYKNLLGVQNKPCLLKKNEYYVVQGFRMIDLNVLRLAIQSAQKCGHGSLLFTEVNPNSSQRDLATQLGLLCSVCGLQTIFCTSSFSEEEPSNYSVNKQLLPELGPYAYYSLINFVQKSTGSFKVNINTNKEGVSVPHKAKLIVSMDRKTYELDRDVKDAEEIVQPDLSGNYENIAEPDSGDNITDNTANDEQTNVLERENESVAVEKRSVIMPNPLCKDRSSEPSSVEESKCPESILSMDTTFVKSEEQEDTISNIKIDSVTGSVGEEQPILQSEDLHSPGLKIRRMVDLQKLDFSSDSNHKQFVIRDGGIHPMNMKGILPELGKPLSSLAGLKLSVSSAADTSNPTVGLIHANKQNSEFSRVAEDTPVSRQSTAGNSGSEKTESSPISPNFKTPLQIFSIEVSRALKNKLPNLTNQQIQRIVIDKWSKMSNSEKQVYRNKAKILSAAQRRTSSSVLDNGLPPGWRRTLVQNKTDVTTGKIEIVLHTPTGEKLKNKKELQEYSRLNNISCVSENVFDFKRAVKPLTAKSNLKVNSPSNTLSKPGSPENSYVRPPPGLKMSENPERKAIKAGIVKEVLTTDNGMKMVRMLVETSSGVVKEALVPASQCANGALKIQLPRQYSQPGSQQSNGNSSKATSSILS